MAGFSKNFTDATIVLSDGTGTPLTHTCDTDKGGFTLSEVVVGLREAIVTERKGAYCSTAFGARKYPQFSLNFLIPVISDTGVGDGTVTDFITGKTGTDYSARISTLAPASSVQNKVPFGCSIGITIEGTDYGDSDETIDLAKCRLISFGYAEGDSNEFQTTWEVLGPISGTLAVAVAT